MRSGDELRNAVAKHAPRVKVVRGGETIAYSLLKL
jgi:hypothetical protein